MTNSKGARAILVSVPTKELSNSVDTVNNVTCYNIALRHLKTAFAFLEMTGLQDQQCCHIATINCFKQKYLRNSNISSRRAKWLIF